MLTQNVTCCWITPCPVSIDTKMGTRCLCRGWGVYQFRFKAKSSIKFLRWLEFRSPKETFHGFLGATNVISFSRLYFSIFKKNKSQILTVKAKQIYSSWPKAAWGQSQNHNGWNKYPSWTWEKEVNHFLPHHWGMAKRQMRWTTMQEVNLGRWVGSFSCARCLCELCILDPGMKKPHLSHSCTLLLAFLSEVECTWQWQVVSDPYSIWSCKKFWVRIQKPWFRIQKPSLVRS